METFNTTPTTKDYFDNLETSYNIVADKVRTLFAAAKDLHDSAPLLLKSYDVSYVLEGFKRNTKNASLPDALTELKRRCWTATIDKTGLHDLMTSKLKEEFRKSLESTIVLPFNANTIYDVMDGLFSKRKDIMIEACRRVYSHFTDYSFWHFREQEGNIDYQKRTSYETWKTNHSEEVGIKVIIPGVGSCSSYRVEGKMENHYSANYSKREQLYDIDRVLGWLSGKKLTDVDTIYDSIDKSYRANEFTGESEFFTYKIFKKGTAHLTWKSDELRTRFNIAVTNGELSLKSPYQKPKKKTKPVVKIFHADRSSANANKLYKDFKDWGNASDVLGRSKSGECIRIEESPRIGTTVTLVDERDSVGHTGKLISVSIVWGGSAYGTSVRSPFYQVELALV